MRYGLPYQGSKNAIARWIVEQLPGGDVFVDAFCGGGAVTHAALVSGKWKKYIMNDIDGRLPELFKDCIEGKFTLENHPNWISREEFESRKFGKSAEDAYIALVWSFSNNGLNYLYGRDIEEYKHDYHKTIYEDNPEYLYKWGFDLIESGDTDIYTRYLDYLKQIGEKHGQAQHIQATQRIGQLQRLQTAERLEKLERLQSLQSLQTYCMDYSDLSSVLKEFSGNITLYCDIPYIRTDGKKYRGFDQQRFYEWAREQDNIFISEYEMPDDFIELNRILKTVLTSTNGVNGYRLEKIFTNERTFEKMNEEQKIIRSLNLSEQMTFEELMK